MNYITNGTTPQKIPLQSPFYSTHLSQALQAVESPAGVHLGVFPFSSPVEFSNPNKISPEELICHFKEHIAPWMPCANLPLENPLIKLALTIVTLKFTDLPVGFQVALREKQRKTLMKKLKDDRTMEGLQARLFDHCGAAKGLVCSSVSGYCYYLNLIREQEYGRPESNVTSSTVDTRRRSD